MEDFPMITENIDQLYEEHKKLITKTIWRNRALLKALRLEDEDVSQQLAIVMLSAIRKFNPDRSSSLAAHIRYTLQYEILNIKRRHKPHGVTGIPKGVKLSFRYLGSPMPDGEVYELPHFDDTSILEVSELLQNLPTIEAEAVSMRIRGFQLKRKAHTAAIAGLRHRYAALCAAGI
jgi:hypothetical protein